MQPTPTDFAADEDQPQKQALRKIEDEVDQCLACHTDQEALVNTAKHQEDVEEESTGEGSGGELALLQTWEKVLVDGEVFGETVHGKINCTACHRGVKSAADKKSS